MGTIYAYGQIIIKLIAMIVDKNRRYIVLLGVN